MTHIMPPELTAKIIWYCTPIDVKAGDVVIDRGEESTDLYIITRGEFKVYDDSRGEDFLLDMLTRGSVFGEMAFLDSMPRSASIMACTDGSLLRLGEREFSRMIIKAPETSVSFLRSLSGFVCRRLRVMNDALAEMAFSGEAIGPQEMLDLRQAMHNSVRVELEEGSQ